MSNSAGFTTRTKMGAKTKTDTQTGTDTKPDTSTKPDTGTKPRTDTTIIDRPESVVKEELDDIETPDEIDGLIDEGIANETNTVDEDSIGECSRDDDDNDPSIDNTFEGYCSLDDDDKDSIDVEDGLPIRVCPEKDVQGETKYRCFVNKWSIGHQSNPLSDAIANRDRIVGAVAKWLEENRQKFLHSFDVHDLGGDSDDQAYREAITALTLSGDKGRKNLKVCPVLQEGLLLLCLIGEKVGKGDGSQTPNFSKYIKTKQGAAFINAVRRSQTPNFSKYMKVLSLRSDDLGKDLWFQVLFSREAKYEWAAAAIRGFICLRKQEGESIRDYLDKHVTGKITAAKWRLRGDWDRHIGNFIRYVIYLLGISYEDVESKVKNER